MSFAKTPKRSSNLPPLILDPNEAFNDGITKAFEKELDDFVIKRKAEEAEKLEAWDREQGKDVSAKLAELNSELDDLLD